MRLPDVIVYPKDEREIHQLLQLAATVKLAVIPFGGGTNVTHAIRCPSIEYESRPIVSIDLRLMNSILSVHDEDGIAHVQAGITGKALVAALAARGFTMGHEPDSYEFSTVGGWIATNASGMKQNKVGVDVFLCHKLIAVQFTILDVSQYGNIEQIVKDVRVVSSKGFIWQSAGPNSICSGRSSIGTNLVSLMIGSEG
jgi:alkyldihydroxyacetonephosphate synthase